MRKIHLSDDGLFVPHSTHACLSTGWDMNKLVYPNQVVIRCTTEGEPIHIDRQRGAVVKVWRWRIAAVGVLTLLVTEDVDGRVFSTADHLAPNDSIMQDFGDVATLLMSWGLGDQHDIDARRSESLARVADAAVCMWWAWMRHNADVISGPVRNYFEWASEQVILCPRFALPLGIRGGCEDLRHPLPLRLL